MKIQLDLILESPNKLRSVTKDEEFFELVNSIRNQGLLQPIKVRPTEKGYELIYGHRRTAAMKELGWAECEVIVEEVDEESALTQSIMENLHRADMSALEEAEIYKNLLKRGFSTKNIAYRIGKSETHVKNRVNLLELPETVQAMITPHQMYEISTQKGKLPISAIPPMLSSTRSNEELIQVAQKAVDEQLTLMQVRELSRQLKQANSPEDRMEVLQKPFSAASENGSKSVAFHTANRSIGDQFHSKWLWNLKRIDLKQYHHFTIGYSQRNLEQLIQLLQISQVSVLVDSRKNAVSQYRPEFSKYSLSTTIQGAGIKYLHIPELGIDSSEREDLAKDHDYESLFNSYANRVKSDILREVLGDKLKSERLAFLCVELDPETCHRHRIAFRLEEMGFKTLDL